MKKILMGAITMLIILVACQNNASGKLGRFEMVGEDYVERGVIITIIRDTKTGCEYTYTSDYSDIISPILNADGKPYCQQYNK
ncbi:hypothetical protein CHH83_02140 [Bacillus sp. 7586-K]|nr:hypothetical protein CHH83_02140 [Bacillus sp. 7586-K]